MGKTTCAAAAAVASADAGHPTLVVSLDPAHSLGDALDVRLRGSPRDLGRRLRAVELDAERALRRWLRPRRDSLVTVTERGTFLDREEAGRLLDLSFPGADELIGLLELERLSAAAGYHHVVVDTAPTGHTLRLLASPDKLVRISSLLEALQAKHRFLARRLGGRYRADAIDRLIDEIAESARHLAALLRDGARTSFTWVLVAEPLALAETEDGLREIERFGGRVGEVLVNRTTPPPPAPCPFCLGRRRSEADVVEKLRRLRPRLSMRLVERQEAEPRGRAALGRLWERRRKRTARPERRAVENPSPDAVPWGEAAGDEVALPFPPGTRLVFFGGKGGVGKTTCAAAAALALARREPGRRILLLSVDPAHSLGDVLGARVGDAETRSPGLPKGLRARELDASRTLAAFRQAHGHVVERLLRSSSGVGVEPAFERAVMERLLDLAPPGLDELMALAAVARALGESAPGSAHDLVIVDSAPTGHALRLLALPEVAGRWARALLELLREYREVLPLEELAPPLLDVSRGLRELARLLRDPVLTRFVVVTRAAALPRLETERLLAALARLGVTVGALLVDGLTPRGCPRCRRDAAREEREVKALRRAVRLLPGGRCTMIEAPAMALPPRGPDALVGWSRTWRVSSA